MTDAQWALLEPLLPPVGNAGGRGGRPEKHSRQRMLDAIFYLLRGGIAWAARRLAYLLADLPLQLIGRIRADRVMLTAAPPPVSDPRGGRLRRRRRRL